MALRFVEPSEDAKEGDRVFSVTANGETVLDELDIQRETESSGAVITWTFTVEVAGGLLDLDFTPIVGDAVVSNIMVSKA